MKKLLTTILLILFMCNVAWATSEDWSPGNTEGLSGNEFSEHVDDNENYIDEILNQTIGYYDTATLAYYNGPKTNSIIITIFEGKNRQIRRMVEAVGLRVKSLRRIGIGNLRDSKLKSGEWRHLTYNEIKDFGYDID